MKQNNAKFIELAKDIWKITALSHIKGVQAVNTSVLKIIMM